MRITARFSRLVLPVLVAGTLFAALPLRAETPAEKRSGRSSFREGMDALEEHEWDRAADAFRAAAASDYRPATSLYNAACALSRKGDKAAALDLLARALEAGFDDPRHMDRDDDLDHVRREPRYRELRRMADELSLPAALDGWLTRVAGELFGSDWDELADGYRAFVRKNPSIGRGWFNLGYAALQIDKPREAREAFAKALELGYRKPTTMYNLACSYARLRQKDAAFEWLFKAMDAGFEPGERLRHDSDLASLRSDPRFREARRRAERWHDEEDDDD